MAHQLEQRQHHSDIPFSEGARVGRLGLSLSLNPYRSHDPLHAHWLRGWQSQVLERARRGDVKPLDELAGGVGFILLVVGAFLALHLGPAHGQPYASLSIGRSSTPEFFDSAARYAFPDLATGGGDCCTLTHSTVGDSDAFRVAIGKRHPSGFGLEGTLASLGQLHSAFDVSGAFWSALGRTDVDAGHCVEAGRFGFGAITLAGTYLHQVSNRLAIVPKLGLSAMFVDVTTTSRCTFSYRDGSTAKVEQAHSAERVSVAPMAGVELRWQLRQGLALTLDFEARDQILVANSPEALARQRGRIGINSIWLGVSIDI